MKGHEKKVRQHCGGWHGLAGGFESRYSKGGEGTAKYQGGVLVLLRGRVRVGCWFKRRVGGAGQRKKAMGKRRIRLVAGAVQGGKGVVLKGKDNQTKQTEAGAVRPRANLGKDVRRCCAG